MFALLNASLSAKAAESIELQGLVSALEQIHDDPDAAAVFDAYGWPHDLTDEEILERLVDLNHERAEEEKQGKIRWLRPEFQNPQGQAEQKSLDLKTEDDKPGKKPKPKAAAKAKKQPFPKSLPERIKAVRSVLQQQETPATPAEISKLFTRTKADTIAELLETLVTVGQARQTDDGRYAA